jgi:hypothetical protein
MIQKKVCMLGGFAVGKTSLVQRFVTSLFSEHYHTTVGVTIEKKSLIMDERDITLMIWDLYGDDEFQRFRSSYLRGSSGYILVADGTRAATLERALHLQSAIETELGHIPFVLIVNKTDLRSEWEIGDEALNELRRAGWTISTGSAKTGEGVEILFRTLAEKMLEGTA